MTVRSEKLLAVALGLLVLVGALAITFLFVANQR
jgi:hypothetical protein